MKEQSHRQKCHRDENCSDIRHSARTERRHSPPRRNPGRTLDERTTVLTPGFTSQKHCSREASPNLSGRRRTLFRSHGPTPRLRTARDKMSANLAEKLANAHVTKLLFIRSTFSLLRGLSAALPLMRILHALAEIRADVRVMRGRHANAAPPGGKKKSEYNGIHDWQKDDQMRPLTDKGKQQGAVARKWFQVQSPNLLVLVNHSHVHLPTALRCHTSPAARTAR